ncbi:MAG: hypothetical protein RLZZ561_718 [Pseudomonadota bacterium]|jgi:ATP-binding cassette subfamily B protein
MSDIILRFARRLRLVPELAEARFSASFPMLLASSAVINLLALALPIVMLILMDRIIPNKSMDTLALMIGGALIAVGVEIILRIVRSQISAWSAAKFEHATSESVAERLLMLPMTEFERTGNGRYLDYFKNVSALRQHFSGQSFMQWIDLPFSILYLLIILVVSWPIALLMALGYGLFGYHSLRSAKLQQAPYDERVQADQRRSNFLIETLSNIHTLKAMAMEALMMRRYDRLQEASATAISRLSYVIDEQSARANLFGPLMSAIVAAVAAIFVINGDMTSGEMSVCIFLSLRSLGPLQRIGPLWARHQSDELLAQDLGSLLARDGLPVSPKATAPGARDGLAIRFENVDFAYPAAKQSLLDKVNFEISPGQTVFIKGTNGSGRSTLLGLMAGFYTPDVGKITIFGDDVRSMDRSNLSRLVGYLPQRAVMYDGTLLQNATMFRDEIADEAIATARQLGYEDFILALPQGWETRVGDSAAESLPPGLRQRIGIIRGLAPNPDILLFDDATASMDNEGEAKMLAYLDAVKGKKTVILVTNRPSIQRISDITLDVLKNSEAELSVPSLMTPSASLQAEVERKLENLSGKDLLVGEAFWNRLDQAVASAFKTPNDLSALVAPLLQRLGWRGPVREVIEALPYFANELDITGLNNAMTKLGYSVSETSGALASIDQRAYPCLILPHNDHAQLLLDVRPGGYQLQAALGQGPASSGELGEGRAFFYTRALENDIPQEKWTLATIIRMRPVIIQAALLSFLIGALSLASSLFTMAVYNIILPSGSLTTLGYLFSGMLIALALVIVLQRHRAEMLSFIAGRVEYLFGTAAMDRILQLSPSYTERSAVGAQIARLGSFEAIRDIFTSPIGSSLLELPATLLVAIVLCIINPVALPIILVVMGVYLLSYFFLQPVTKERVAALGRISTLRNEFLVEMVTKMRGIRESRAEQAWLARYRLISADSAVAAFRVEQTAGLLSNLAYAVMMVAGLLLIAFTVPLAFESKIGAGSLIASLLLVWRVLGPMQVVFTNLSRIERVRSAAQQFDTLMLLKGERLAPEARAGARSLQGKIEFSRVSFRYSMQADPALIGVSVNVEPGGSVAITGQNGGGKSTFLKLLLGMYAPQAGTIRIDGVDIRQIDPVNLRRLVGYVPQDMQFFRATIAQNLRFAQPDATDDELKDALELAGAWTQISQLPRGLDYRIGDGASEQIPASLRQKMALARAYLTRAPILLFDEPGAGLDGESDACFAATLQALKGKRTVIFISHRPSHMKIADTVLLFQGGYLMGAANPDELFRTAA